ncbi:hypothetical protein L484_020251 [Morus notabilis]|uniref:Uncharacterized protein n=1 Tax=Morus notabilis TaxID=981085 RepID=W9RMN5_9ROSA|nr:hypothetical protein L484_020251 [Morus notabilis]
MEEFEKKLSIKEESCSVSEMEEGSPNNSKVVALLRRFLAIQQRRAEAYSKLKWGFEEYVASGGELAYQQLCSEITLEFSDCSKQVLEIESLFLNPDYCRGDLAQLLRAVQTQEKQKLHLFSLAGLISVKAVWNVINAPCFEGRQPNFPATIKLVRRRIQKFHSAFTRRQDGAVVSIDASVAQTATIQVLKKAGRPSERLVSHTNCKFEKPTEHECVHVHEITEAAGTEEAEADAEYDNALKEAIRGVQDSVTAIIEHMEEVRYEIAALEAD